MSRRRIPPLARVARVVRKARMARAVELAQFPPGSPRVLISQWRLVPPDAPSERPARQETT